MSEELKKALCFLYVIFIKFRLPQGLALRRQERGGLRRGGQRERSQGWNSKKKTTMNNDSPIIVVCTDRCGHLRHSCQRLAAVAAVATRCKASTKKSIFFRNKPIGTFFEGSLRGRKICFMLLIAYGYSQKRWIKYAIQLLQTCSEMEKEWQTKK